MGILLRVIRELTRHGLDHVEEVPDDEYAKDEVSKEGKPPERSPPVGNEIVRRGELDQKQITDERSDEKRVGSEHPERRQRDQKREEHREVATHEPAAVSGSGPGGGTHASFTTVRPGVESLACRALAVSKA